MFKAKKIVVLFFLITSLLVGLLGIYRATLKVKDLTLIRGKVIDKRISHFTSGKSGTHYYLAFRLSDRQDEIAINLGTKNQADKNTTFDLIDIGKIYKFYLDPTVPTQNGINWGINKIDYDGYEVYRTSNRLNLYGGAFLSLLSLAGIIIVIKFKKRER